jgi:hypothetical protein
MGTHRLSFEPTRSMKAVTGEVEMLLAGLEEKPRTNGALLASELIAQVVGRAPDAGDAPVDLTIQVRDDAIRLEATGPVPPSLDATAEVDGFPDPLADWGRFIIEALADRWGIGEGPKRDIWAEIDVLR